MRASITITAEATGPGIPESWTEAELRKQLAGAVDWYLDDMLETMTDRLEEPEPPARLVVSVEGGEAC